ncbi:HORMA domain-containing protein [Xylogone sp. PMI_703]|nr:HORMA domain-containing protein [Xylogone sp. PMI_703]
MRARQQLAPRPKPRPSELIVVDQQQSFELVRTVVSATISNIAFLRDLFPEDCFQSRFYDTADPDATYTTFMKGSKKQHSIRKQCEGLVNWKVLVRGTNPRVNKLLDWLEIGAADALKRKYLEKLQLSVFDARSPDPALLEAYIWTFSYENEVPTVQFGTQTPGEGIVFLSNAKRELRHMVHDVIREVQELPDLPDSYEPFGFHPETNPSFLSGAVERPTLTNMDTGLHKVCINVLKPDDVSQSSITEGAPRLCELSVRNSSQNARAANTGSTPPSAIESLVSANFTYQETPARGQLEETQDTQFPSSSTVEPNESGTIQTSLLSSLIIPSFSRVILNRMLASARKQKRRENGDPERVITCECNTMTNSDNLLTCELCGNFVHPECYGFLEYPSSNPVWVCYSCMLEGEPLQLEEMKQLCAYRRALYYIHCNGYPARTIDLANHLNITEKKTRDLARILWRKGYLKEARHARRKGFSQTGLPYYQYIGDESKLRAGYFDPTLKVTHYVCVFFSLFVPDA